MEMINLAFVILIAFIFVSGIFVFYGDMQSSYAPLAATDPGLANLSEAMNVNAQMLNNVTNTTTTSSLNTQNLNAAAIFGYVTGAINALSTLVEAPTIFITVVNDFNSMTGAAIVPQFVITAIGEAVFLIVLIGLLFYLLKVK